MTSSPAPRTLFEKIWSDHVIVVSPQGEALLYVDFNLINEGQSFLAFDQLRIEGRQSRRPEQHLAVTDHYLPTINRERGTSYRITGRYAQGESGAARRVVSHGPRRVSLRAQPRGRSTIL